MTTEYRILAIDDDPLMRGIVAAALGTERSFAVTCCESGEAGLSMAASWSPDLILCDVSMPGLDGHEVLRRLRADAATASIPLIFTTGRAGPDDVDAMLALGAIAVIAKPFKLRDLIATVRRELFLPDEANASDIAAPAYDFTARLRADAISLRRFGEHLVYATMDPDLKDCVHRLAGAAGMYGFATVSASASAVEQAIADYRATNGDIAGVRSALEQLVKHVDQHAR